jgi:hypothetical protein
MSNTNGCLQRVSIRSLKTVARRAGGVTSKGLLSAHMSISDTTTSACTLHTRMVDAGVDASEAPASREIKERNHEEA